MNRSSGYFTRLSPCVRIGIEISELDDAAGQWKKGHVVNIVNIVSQIAIARLHGAIKDAMTKLMPTDIIGVITAALLGTANVRHE